MSNVLDVVCIVLIHKIEYACDQVVSDVGALSLICVCSMRWRNCQ